MSCPRCEGLPDKYLEARKTTLLKRGRGIMFLNTILISIMLVAFGLYWGELIHRRALLEADRKLNHAENQEIIREVRALAKP